MSLLDDYTLNDEINREALIAEGFHDSAFDGYFEGKSRKELFKIFTLDISIISGSSRINTLFRVYDSKIIVMVKYYPDCNTMTLYTTPATTQIKIKTSSLIELKKYLSKDFLKKYITESIIMNKLSDIESEYFKF